MKRKVLQVSGLVAVFYFLSGNMAAQTTPADSTSQTQNIQEVVMIGYGSRKKIDNTAAISSISAKQITQEKVVNATQAMQGMAAGVNVVANDLPGSTPMIMIRGLGTVLSGRQPLYVVDGMYADNINNINPNDILSIDVLKDASALAIYGNRGANGVIIVTTKTGQGKITLDYNGFAGVRNPLKVVKMAGSNLYALYTNTALGTTKFSQDQPVNTDWFHEISQPGSYYENNISISGASESAKYFLSLDNYNENTILKGDKFNRTTVRTNNQFKIRKGITLEQTLSLAFTNTIPKPLSAFTNAYKQSPIVPVFFPGGHYGVPFVGANGFASPTGSSAFNNVGNPVSQLAFDNEKLVDFLMQGGLKLDVQIVKPLKFTSQFSGEYDQFRSYSYADQLGIWLAADPTRVASAYPATFDQDDLTNQNSNYFNWVLSNYLTYHQTFNGIHDLEVMAGMESSAKDGVRSLNVVRRNVGNNPDNWNLGGVDYEASKQVVSLNSIRGNRNTTISYFGRLEYKLMNRYLLTASVRRDGSSQFANGHKWGTFPAFGAGWVITNESFMQGGFFNLLKLRGGWGRLGNQNVPLNLLTITSGLNYTFNGQAVANGITIQQVFDPALSWEITQETSGGFDFAVLQSRLTGSIDAYDRKTKNIILSLSAPLTAGLSQNGFAPMGQVSNKGVEFSAQWKDNIGQDFTYSIGGNYSYNKNNVDKIFDKTVAFIHGGGLGNGQYVKNFDYTTVGHPLGSYWLWKTDGYDANGNFQYVDTNGNGLTGAQDLNDRVYMGSSIPTSTYGVSVNLTYRNWDLSLNGYGTAGAKVYNGLLAQRFSGENIPYSVATDFWTPTNTSAPNPAPFNNVPIASDYYLKSADYFRLNNVNIGYTVKDLKAVSSLRIFVSAINPFIVTKYKGFTPEVAGDGNPYGTQGVELDAYPTLRSVLMGVDIKF